MWFQRFLDFGKGIGIGDTDAKAVEPGAAGHQFAQIIRNRDAFGRRIGGVGAGYGLQKRGGIGGGAGQRAEGIDAPRIRHAAVAADPAVGGFQPEYATHRRRQTDGAAGIRAERPIDQAGRDGGAGTARRAAGDAVAVPGIAAIAEGLVVPGAADGEFGLVEPADGDRAGGVEAAHQGRCLGRHMVAADGGAEGRRYPGAVEKILVRQRHSVQQPGRLARRQVGIPFRGTGQRRLGLDVDETVETRLSRLGGCQAGFGHRDRRQFAAADCRRDLDQAHRSYVVRHLAPFPTVTTVRQAGGYCKAVGLPPYRIVRVSVSAVC